MSAREKTVAVRRLLVSGVTAFTLATAAGVASAAEYTWNNFQGGDFENAGNWTPAGGPPTFVDTATFTNPANARYTVTLSGRTPRVYSLKLTGGTTTFKGFYEVNSGLDDALIVRNNGASPGQVTFDTGVRVSGGINVSGTTGDPNRFSFLTAPFIEAGQVTVLAGYVNGGGVQVAHDVQVGNPGAARGDRDSAWFGGSGSVGGAVRVHPDGGLGGNLTVTGGVENAGRIAGGVWISGDLVNAGVLVGGEASNNFPRSTVVGDFVQTPDGTLRLWATTFPTYKPLNLSGGTVDIGGTIVFTPVAPWETKVGDRFPLVGAAGPINYSANLVSGIVGMSYQPQLVPGDGLYAVTTAVPEPAGAATLLAAAGLLLRRRRALAPPAPHATARTRHRPDLTA